MLDTKELAKDIWSIDNLDSKRKLALSMISKLSAKNETKERFKETLLKCKSMNKIDKLVADITLVGYDLKVI